MANPNKTPLLRPFAWLAHTLWGWFIRALVNIIEGFDDISSGISYLIMLPINDVQRAIERSKNHGADWGVLLMLPFTGVALIVGVAGRILLSPGDLFLSITRRQFKQALWAFPLTLVLGICVFYVAQTQGWFGVEARLAKIKRDADNAFEKMEFESAAAGYSKMIELGSDLDDRDLFNLYEALKNSDQQEKADALLSQLAPGSDGVAGMSWAHTLMAVQLAKKITQPIDPELEKELAWHLNASGDAVTLEHNMAWAKYLVVVNQTPKAIIHLLRVSNQQPEKLLTVANLYAQLGQDDYREGALQKAKAAYQDLVKSRPKDSRLRAIYVGILTELQEYELAESELVRGLELSNNNQVLNDAFSELYLNLGRDHRISKTFSERFGALRKSLQYKQDQMPAYQAIIDLYRSINNEADRKTIYDEFVEQADFGSQSSMAHFTFSNILWVEGNQAESLRHMEFAFESDKRLASVANNLAWLICHQSDPDLRRAQKLATSAVELAPQNPIFRDTLGTVYLKNGDFQLAVNEFEKALPVISDKQEVHRKLSVAYEKLGIADLADSHRKKSEFKKPLNE